MPGRWVQRQALCVRTFLWCYNILFSSLSLPPSSPSLSLPPSSPSLFLTPPFLPPPLPPSLLPSPPPSPPPLPPLLPPSSILPSLRPSVPPSPPSSLSPSLQEEIRFVISPECLVSLLLCERMERYEAILISGAEQFSSYSGYGTRFKYTGPVADPNPVSPDNQRCVSIVAIDAIPYSFSGDTDQFGKENLLLELNKAFCGFSFITPLDEALHDKWVPVATGNWGCGAFGGNKELKTLLQWMAASRARRTIRYYSFNGDGDLQTRQREVVECLRACGTTVGQLYGILRAGGLARGAVFEEVMRAARALAG